MIYGYARVSTDGQSVAAQVATLRKHGAGKVFREVASGAKTDRAQLRRLLDQLDADDVLMVTRLDRLARSTRDLLNTVAAITAKEAGLRSLGDAWAAKEAGLRSLGDAWADTTTPHGRLSASNVLEAVGRLQDHDKLYLAVTDNSLHRYGDVANIVVKSDANGVIRLGQVATVRDDRAAMGSR